MLVASSQPGARSAAQHLARGRQVLARQPCSVLLGARLQVCEPGRAEIGLPVTQVLLQQHGFVQGGVLAYLADNALTCAGGSLLGDCVTGEFKINDRRPAIDGESRLAVAGVVGSGKTQAVSRCKLFVVRAGERVLCAAAQGTIVKVGP
jgi:uncharacterized protein (TIGR00369 family)